MTGSPTLDLIGWSLAYAILIIGTTRIWHRLTRPPPHDKDKKDQSR